LFAALTAILAKVGGKGTGGNVATAIRTGAVLLLAWGIVLFSGQIKTDLQCLSSLCSTSFCRRSVSADSPNIRFPTVLSPA
jgi:uncharacterized membrane protein